jgi:hypothetical protein
MDANSSSCAFVSGLRRRRTSSAFGMFDVPMTANATATGWSMQPISVGSQEYPDRVDSYDDFETLKSTVAANVDKLMTHHWGRVNKTKLAREASELDPLTGEVKAKAGQGTYDRLKDPSKDVGVKVLHRIARAFGLEAWHLMVPDLDPAKPPTCRALSPLAADLAVCFDRIEDDELRRSLHATIDQLAQKNPAGDQGATSPAPTEAHGQGR